MTDTETDPHGRLVAVARRLAAAATPFISAWELDVHDPGVDGEALHAELAAALAAIDAAPPPRAPVPYEQYVRDLGVAEAIGYDIAIRMAAGAIEALKRAK